MTSTSFSIRTSLGVIIFLMGALSFVLALTTGEVYRQLAMDNQQQALTRIIELKSQDLLAELEDHSKNLGAAQQRDKEFRQAVSGNNRAEIKHLLNNQFHQYFVTADVISLEKLYVFNQFFSLLAQSSDGSNIPAQLDTICPGLIGRAKQRHGAHRLRNLSELCLYQGKPYFAVMVSIGGLRISGYLLVITDPAHYLRELEKQLDVPLQLKSANGTTLYKSDHWPENHESSGTLVAHHKINTHSREPALDVMVAFDQASLNQQLQNTRYMVLLAVTITTLLAILLAILVFQKTTFKPLNTLTRQLHRVRNDRAHLGEQVNVKGNKEVAELAQNFNSMTSELRSLYASLENLAFTDSLTELPNRTLFHDRLTQVVNLSERNQERFAVFMMDLDRFKEINDTLGHQVGDKLLKEVSARLMDILRKSDTVARIVPNTIARLGGDEFAAILPTISQNHDAIIVAHKIHQAMEEPFTIDGHSLQISVSTGIVIYPDHGSEGQALLQHADIAMYEAKRNQQEYAIYDTLRDKTSLAQLTMISQLRKGIQKDELLLYLQPKIDLRSGVVAGIEALVRWKHPEHGIILPDEFIPLAEHTGLIKPLTHWVLSNAVKICKKLHDLGYPMYISINISVRNLHEPELLDYVSYTLAKNNLDGKWLCLELTESAIMSDSQRAMMVLQALDVEGIMLSIDDFGTGYSSLSHLKKLPVDEIKIDRSFVMDMLVSSNDSTIVRSTIDLAHNMGLMVTAEGVDNTEVKTLLINLGCDLAQGFHFGKPMTLDEFLDWLTKSEWGMSPTNVSSNSK